MVLAVRNWAFGVPRPLGLVEPATRTGVRRLGGVERVTNPWETESQTHGRGSTTREEGLFGVCRHRHAGLDPGQIKCLYI